MVLIAGGSGMVSGPTGESPAVLDSAEIYLGLQQKVVDGLEYPVPDMFDAKLYEVSKFMSLTGHVTDFFVVSMNKPLWDGMAAEQPVP